MDEFLSAWEIVSEGITQTSYESTKSTTSLIWYRNKTAASIEQNSIDDISLIEPFRYVWCDASAYIVGIYGMLVRLVGTENYLIA